MDDEQLKRNFSKVADPEEFLRLLKQFGEEALAGAEKRGRDGAVNEMLRIIELGRMSPALKRWLINQCRGLLG